MNTTSQSFKKMTGGAIGLLMILVIIVAAYIVTDNLRLRKDLTSEKIYSLSDGTRAVLSKLDKDVTLKFFFSRSLQETPIFLKDFANRIENLLEEYRIASGGRITVEFLDPKPDTDEEDAAVRMGISGQSMGVMGPMIYIGLGAVCGKEEAAMPVVDPRAETMVEYNITRLIYRISHPVKPVIGVLSSLPVLGMQQDPMMMMRRQSGPPPWVSFAQLKDQYNTIELQPDVSSIDANMQAVIVMHPKELPDKTLLALDQYLLRGGRLLVFVDPLSLADLEASSAMQSFGRPPSTSSDLPKLLEAWGVKFENGRILADIASSTRIRSAQRLEDSPVWLSLRKDNINSNDVVTSGLETLMLPFAGSFTVTPASNRTVTTLLKSSPSSSMIESMMAQFGGDSIRRDFKRSGIAMDIAVRMSGTFQTAFPQGVEEVQEEPAPDPQTGKLDEKTAKDKKLILPERKEGQGTVILVADTDLLADRNCVEPMNFFGFNQYQPVNDNIPFLLNLMEQLTGSQDLIGLRSRGEFQRPFDRVLAMEEKARLEWQDRQNELQKRLQDTREQLRQLQQQKDPKQQMILTPAQKEAIDNFRKDEIAVQRQLREVEKGLQKEINRLGWKVKTWNIVLIPLLVVLAGIGYGLFRRSR